MSTVWNKWYTRCYKLFCIARRIDNTRFYSLPSMLSTTLRTSPVDFKRHIVHEQRRLRSRVSNQKSSRANIYFPAVKRALHVTFETLPYVNYCRYASASFCFTFPISPLLSETIEFMIVSRMRVKRGRETSVLSNE